MFQLARRFLMSASALLMALSGALFAEPVLAQRVAWECPRDSTQSFTEAKTTASTPVYARPSTSARVFDRLPRNTRICANGSTVDGVWLTIRTRNGVVGYVQASQTTPRPRPAATLAPSSELSPIYFPPSNANTVYVAKDAFEFGAQVERLPGLDPLKATGMRWVKLQIVFTDDAPNINAQIKQAHDAGMKLLVTAIGDRRRPNDADVQARYAIEVGKLARAGVDAIEIWNQPNLPREWGGENAAMIDPLSYTALLKQSYASIKRENPATLVIGANIATTGFWAGNCTPTGCDDEPYLRAIAAAGAGAHMDCQGAMMLSNVQAPDLRTSSKFGAHHSWYLLPTLDVVLDRLNKPVCFTHLGSLSKDGFANTLPLGFSWANETTTEQQARWNVRALEVLRDSGKVRLAILYNWDFRSWGDDPQAGFAIVRADGSCPTCTLLKSSFVK
jgi:hypothetical protein